MPTAPPVNAFLADWAADKIEELRAERDSARGEVADLREALRLAQITPRTLLERIALHKLQDTDRLIVMAQNPGDSHRWSRSVSDFITVAEIRAALEA
jgi:hypothetical protein